MQSLLQVLEKSTAYLDKKGVENPKLNAELLIAEALGMKRLDLYLQHDRPLEEARLKSLRDWIQRRGQREPLQHIIGHTDFYGLRLKTDKRALVPRPETEELVDRLVSRFKDKPPARIADLGTGSGAIALALAQSFSQAEVVGVDFSEEALSLAKENAERNELGRVQFIQGSWDSAPDTFDLIVSNPPYLTVEEWESAEPEVKTFDPKSALVADHEGLSDLLDIISLCKDKLNTDGMLALETGIAQHDALKEKAAECGYSGAQGHVDQYDRPRFFLLRK